MKLFVYECLNLNFFFVIFVFNYRTRFDKCLFDRFFGFLGFFLRRRGFDLGIVILAYVLGPIFERSVRQALSISDGDPAIFLHSPLSIGFAVAAAVILGAGLWPRRVAAPRA